MATELKNSKIEESDPLDFFSPLTNKKVLVIISIVSCIIYFNVLFNGFVWDDIPFILNNPDVHKFNLLNFFNENSFNREGYYRPLSAMYFSVMYALFGTNAFFYHFFQVLLHTLNTFLVFMLLQRFFKKQVALILTLFFLLHPIQVESVAFIGASQSVLFFFFGIIALSLSIKEKLQTKSFFLIALLLLMSLLFKETAVIFIVVILAYQYIFKKERFIKFFSVSSIVIALYSVIRFVIGGVYFEKIESVPIAKLTLLERLVNIPEIISYYLKTVLFPLNLAVNQQWTVNNLTFQQFYIPLVISILFLFLLFVMGSFSYKKNKEIHRVFIFFTFWFILSFCMLLQIFPLDMTVADRWFYLPMVGLVGMTGCIAQIVKVQNKTISSVILIGIIILLSILSIRTMVRNVNWNSQTSLYAHDILIEDNYENRNNYAAGLSADGRWQDALINIKKSVEYYPYESNLRGLGVAYSRTGNNDKAIEYLNKALQSNEYTIANPHKHERETYLYIAIYHNLYGSLSDANHISIKGIEDYPDSFELWVLLAISKYNSQDQQGALNAAEKAYSLAPNKQTTYILEKIGKQQPLSVNDVL